MKYLLYTWLLSPEGKELLSTHEFEDDDPGLAMLGTTGEIRGKKAGMVVVPLTATNAGGLA